jgi:thiol-disulfide isomerase/thioredoxin
MRRAPSLSHSLPHALSFSLCFALASLCQLTPAHAADKPWPAPEFTHQAPADWLNSPPVKLADLQGKVVVLDFWTFGCWNCYRSFPWLNGVRERFAQQGVQVVGIHSPETDSERNPADILEKAKKFAVTNPVMIDNDFSYWKAMGNRYWPTFYVLDKKGRVRGQFIGETHDGDKNAMALEAMLKKLLAEN